MLGWFTPSFDWTSAAKQASLANICEEDAMYDNRIELVNHLFAAATEMLEDAAGVAVEGQSPRLQGSQLANHGVRLRALARDITTIAEAAAIIAKPDANHASNREPGSPSSR